MKHLLKKYCKFFIFSLLITNNIYSFALPRGCEVKGFAFHEEDLILNPTGAQAFFLIQNTAAQPLLIERYDGQESWFTPKLHATFSPGNWSAFASNVANMHFKCAVWSGETATVIPCSDAIQICQYPRAAFAASNMGNYWVSSNKTQMQVVKDAAAKGIYLHW